MTLSFATKQRLTVAGILFIVAAATHFAYHLLNPQWISYRKAEQKYLYEQWDEAIEYYQESFSSGLKKPEAMLRIAEAYSKIRNFPKSIHWYETYLSIKPHDIWARRSLAGVLTANQEFEKASKQYQLIMEEESKKKIPKK